MSGAGDTYISSSQQCLLAMIDLLAAKPFDGVTAAQAERAVVGDDGEPLYSRDQCFRTMRNLGHAGWAEQTHGGAWRLTPRATGMSERVRVAIADLHRAYLSTEEDAEEPK